MHNVHRTDLNPGDRFRTTHGTEYRVVSLLTGPGRYELIRVGEGSSVFSSAVYTGDVREITHRAPSKADVLHTDLRAAGASEDVVKIAVEAAGETFVPLPPPNVNRTRYTVAATGDWTGEDEISVIRNAFDRTLDRGVFVGIGATHVVLSVTEVDSLIEALQNVKEPG